MNNETESVCVFVRAYNAGRFIVDCLKSLRESAYPGKIYVKILFDEGTNDNTLEILNNIDFNTFNANNRDFEIIKHQNSSPFRALLKYGFERFEDKYSYYAILDYDNLYSLDYINLAIKHISRNPNGNFLYSTPKIIDASGNEIGYLTKKPALPLKFLKYRILFSNFIDASAIFMDQNCLEIIISRLRRLRSSTFDWIFEDWLIGALSLKYCTVNFLPEFKVYYRIHESNTTIQNSKAEKDGTNYNRSLLTILALIFLNDDYKLLKIVGIFSLMQSLPHFLKNRRS
jgi:hypothetical protein